MKDACDHTKRAVEAYGINWSKQSAPDFIGNLTLRYNVVKDLTANSTLKAWGKDKNDEKLVQDRKAGLLIPLSKKWKSLKKFALPAPEHY